MDKVHCLKKLYTKVTGKEITDPDVDTICEVLHLLADDIDITNKEDITTEFTTPVLNTDKYSGTCTVGVLKSGATYQVIDVALVHTYGEATAELQILTDGLLAIDDNLIFGCQFIFIA